MKNVFAVGGAVLLTGCGDFLSGAAELAGKSSGATWPQAFMVVGVCASLAYVLGKVFE